MKRIRNSIFMLFGWTAFALGFIGAFLPLLPTTPFMLLAAYFFSKGSPRMYKWLIELPTFGPMIKHWNEYGIISKRAKRVCFLTITLVMIYIAFGLAVPVWAKYAAILTLVCVLTFIGSRPSSLNSIKSK